MAQQSNLKLSIDMRETELIVIDLRKSISSRQAAPQSTSTIVENGIKVAEAFRKNDATVFLVHANATEKDMLYPITNENLSSMRERERSPKDWTEIVPELGPKDGDIVVTKKQWGGSSVRSLNCS